MKNLLEKERRKGGFTLAEMLLTTALALVLMSIVAVSANSMIRSGRQASLDRQAQQLYVALSRNAMMLSVSGQANVAALPDEAFEGPYKVVKLGYSSPEPSDPPTEKFYYRLSSKNRADEKYKNAIAALMPLGSVSDELYNGEWIITYSVIGNAANIVSVFYSRAEDVKDDVFVGSSQTFQDVLLNPEYYAASAEVRQTETNGRIGYYGGGASTVSGDSTPTPITAVDWDIEKPEKLTSAFTVRNEEELVVNVLCNVPRKAPYYENGALKDVTFTLTVTGAASGKTKPLTATRTQAQATEEDIINEVFIFDCSFTLDSLKDGKRFKDPDLFPDFTPGEDLQLSLSVECGGVTSTAPMKTVNSLFASASDADAYKVVKIQYGRHLQNLDAATSGVNIGDLSAVQENAIDFSADGSGTEYWKDTYGVRQWTPISNQQLKKYDGGGYEIKSLPTTVPAASGGPVGLFGTYYGSEIRNVALVDAQGINGGDCAGGLVGQAVSGLTIDNCGLRRDDLVASPFTKRANDVDVKDKWLSGTQYAGGLVGKADAALTIQRSYAATVVNAGTSGTAGGLVGQADGLLTVGRQVNDFSPVRFGAYADCYVAGKTVGGLVGHIAADADFKNCFSAGFVLGANAIADAGAFYATKAAASEITIDNTCYTVFNFTDIADTGDKVTYNDNEVNENPTEVADASATEPKGNYYGLDHAQSETQLDTDEMRVYPYNLFGLPAHYGDWHYDAPLGLNVVATNGDKLYATISYHDESHPENQLPDTFYIAVSGETSGLTKFFQIDLTKSETNPTAAVTSYQTVTTGAATSNVPLPTSNSANEDTSAVRSLYAGIASASYSADTGYTVKFTLDDITANDRHFSDLFVGADGTGHDFIPGEYLKIRAYESKSMTWKALLTPSAPAFVNSLFSDETDADGAIIANTRHLQNLDPSISNVPATVTKATLQNDITWDGAAFPQIYAHGRTNANSISGSFYGIYNPALASFEGDEFTLSGYVINGAPSAISADGAGNAGLFRLVTNALTVQNLRMSGFSVTAAADKHAGTLAAEVGKKGASQGNLTITDCLAESFGVTGTVYVRASGSGSAGGLVGAVTGCELTVTNSAASVLVKSDAAAGGLIGSSNDKVTIQQSYAGGHTDNGKYRTDDPKKYNVVGGTAAGGLIGYVKAGTFSATQSFSAASVAVTGDSGYAGGLVGRASDGEDVTLNYVYAIAPVYGAEGVAGQATVTYNGRTGAVVGISDNNTQIRNENSYYLPEIYENCVLSGTNASNIPVSGKAGDLKETVHLAYYDRADGNGIAARTVTETMEIKTFPYDDALNGIGKEFPFSVWTQLSFDGFDGQRVYYGDWQAVLKPATQSRTLTVFYVDGGAFQTRSGDGWSQTVLDNGDGYSLLLPALSDIEKPGYKIKGWHLMADYDESAKTGRLIQSDKSPTETIGEAEAETKAKNGEAFQFTDDGTGRVKIPSEYIRNYGNLALFAVYEENTQEFRVTFQYPENGNGAYRQFGQTWSVKTEQERDASGIIVPSKNIVGYRFTGWKDDKGNSVAEIADGETAPSGAPFIQNGEMTIPKELITAERGDWTFYAQYEEIKYGVIAIDFLYHVEGSDQRFPLSSTPTYQDRDDVKQYKIQYVLGMGYHDDVILPVTTPDEIVNSAHVFQYALDEGHANGDLIPVDTSVITCAFKEGDATKLSLSTTQDKGDNAELIRLVVLYTFPLTAVKTWNYRIEYQMERSSGDSLSDLTYSASSKAVFYKDSAVYQTPEGVTPNITLEDMDGWTRTTNKADLELQADTAHPGDYKVVVEYERNVYRLTFDTSGGTYVEETSRYFGEPFLRGGKLTNEADPTRTGYDFADWSLHKKGDSSVTYDNGGNMPAYNVEASANWNALQVKYRVMYWKQNANDDEYTYAGTEEGTGDTDSMTNVAASNDKYDFFHLRTETSAMLAGKTYSLVNGAQTPQRIQGDGSTIVNVFYDRNLYTLRFLYGRLTPNASYSELSISDISKQGPVFIKNGSSYLLVSQYKDENGDAFYGYESASGSKTVYVATDATSGSLYGYVNGSYLHLDISNSTATSYNWGNALGQTVYTRSGSRGNYQHTPEGTADSAGLISGNNTITPSGTYYYVTGTNWWGSPEYGSITPTKENVTVTSYFIDGTLYTGTRYAQKTVTEATVGTTFYKNNGSYQFSTQGSTSNDQNTDFDNNVASATYEQLQNIIQNAVNDKQLTSTIEYRNNKYYYYLDLTARYEAYIKDKWPDIGLMGDLGSSTPHHFVSWITKTGSHYRYAAINSSGSQQATGGNATIKGQYATMSRTIIGMGNDANYTAVSAENGVAHVLLGRYKKASDIYNYIYQIYLWNDYGKAPPSSADGYTEQNCVTPIVEVDTWSQSAPSGQTAPEYEGYECKTEPSTEFSTTHPKNHDIITELKFTYLPYKYKIAFYNVFDKTTQDVLMTSHTDKTYYFNQSITDAGDGVQLLYSDGTALPTVTETAQSTQDARFVGWSTALGATSADMRYNKNAVTMPAGSAPEAVALVLYPIMEPYVREVSFNLNYDDAPPAPASVTLESGKSLESVVDGDGNRVVVDANGMLIGAYKPTRPDDATHSYEFVGWFQDADGTKPLALSEPIHEDTELYAKWEATEKEVTQVRDVTVEYVKVEQVLDDDGKPVLDDNGKPKEREIEKDTETYGNLSVGHTLMLQPKEFDGWYPEVSVAYHTVSADTTKNTVTFKYTAVAPWDYYVEYYIRCSSKVKPTNPTWEKICKEYQDISQINPMEMGAGYQDYKIATYDTKETDVYKSATHQYESVEFKMPDGYGTYYHYLGYSYNADADAPLITATTATIDANYKNDASKPLKFYIEPDPSAFSAQSWSKTYDGESVAAHNERDADIPATPTVEATILDAYCYLDAAGEVLAADKVVDAGLYSANAYAILKMEETKENAEKETNYFLLWMDETSSLNLRIGRRPVTIASVSASQKHGDTPLTTPANKLYDDNGNVVESGGRPAVYVSSGDFVKNQGFTYAFSVEAFRMDAGVSDNSFTYWLSEGGPDGSADANGYYLTKADNYDITIVYGTLRVFYEVTFAPKQTDNAEQNALAVGGSMNPVEVPASGDKPSATLTYKLPDCGFTPPKGWEFDHWIVDGASRNKGDTIQINKHTTVTAKWRKLPEPPEGE